MSKKSPAAIEKLDKLSEKSTGDKSGKDIDLD